MAKDISLLGAQYSDVPGVTLPQTGGGTATFWDIDDTTATAADVLAGTYFYDEDGEKTEGSIEAKSGSDLTVSGDTVTVPAGYYDEDASASVDTGSYAASVNAHSVTTTPVVTGALSGTGTNIGTTTQPSGTDGTDYWTFTPGGSVTTTGKSTASGKATVSQAGYIDAGSDTSSNSVVDITPTVSSGTARYIKKGAITNNTSGGTSSGTVNRGSQIKIGAGYYPSDNYYTAQANSGTKTISSSGTISVDGYANVSVAAGSNTVNVTGGTPNISTINRGMQIKIGAGYHASDVYYTAQANSGTLTITQSGTTSCDGYANVSVPNDCVILNVSATSSTSTTISNSDITSDYYVFNTASSMPSADVSWSTSNGSVTLSCSGGIPAMTLFLCRDL